MFKKKTQKKKDICKERSPIAWRDSRLFESLVQIRKQWNLL